MYGPASMDRIVFSGDGDHAQSLEIAAQLGQQIQIVLTRIRDGWR